MAMLMAMGAALTPPALGQNDAGSNQAAVALDDNGLRREVERRWREAGGLNERLRVEVRDARALLTGRAANPDERVTGVRLAWQVDGLKEVINEIGIGDESGLSDRATDMWITAQLRKDLMTDPEITSSNFTIETVNQVIYLMGRARSPQELERVRNHAREIARVRRVVSHVQVPN
ncbi:BON domain-containing protein [Niveispirillum lacus]|nr:BON domain-containing protein [Niveispirillum lacus]